MTSMSFAAGKPAIRRLGAAAFAFFFLKGLLWLAAPFLFLWFT